MPIITVAEIVKLVVITFILGYIFMDYVSPGRMHDVFPGRKRWFEDLKFAAMIIAPAVIIHELAHKFVAMAYGFPAMFNIYWFGLGIGVVLKLVGSPILILAPAYVSYPAMATATQNMIIAFAGPFANLLMFAGATLWLKFGRPSRNWMIILALTKKINLFLFIFNMIPLMPFDGYYVFKGLFSLF